MPLAQHLGLDVVAEGVETIEQAALLKELQCKYAQGFLFSRPLAAEDVQKLLAKAAAAPSSSGSSDAAPDPSRRPPTRRLRIADLEKELAAARVESS